MKIKIKQSIVQGKSIVEQILESRGLTLDWLNSGPENFNDGAEMLNYEKGRDYIDKVLKTDGKVGILVDQDFDGFASSSIMYMWLKEKHPEIKIEVIMPDKKSHGIVESITPQDLDFLIIPDASSSEVSKHKKLEENGTELFILDHHEFSEYGSPSIIINPMHKDCKYPNKGLSGAGVVYKFIEAYDKEKGNDVESHTKYLDLVAGSIVSDVMSIKNKENKALVNLGLSNPENPFFTSFLRNDKRVKGKPVNPITIAFYFAPIVNATIRVGTVEDKMDMFDAIVGNNSADTTLASLYSLKRKQDTNKESVIPRIANNLQKNDGRSKKIIIAEVPINLHKSSTGLVAGNLASAYQKPVMLGRVVDDNLVGSIRSLQSSNIENFKDFLEESGLVNWVRGHQSAAGFSIPVKNIEKLLEYAEEELPEFESSFEVEFDISSLTPKEKQDLVEELVVLDNHYGTDFPEVLLYDRITTSPSSVMILGANQNTVKISNQVEYIKFRTKNFPVPEAPTDYKLVVKPSINEYMGNRKPQFIIKELEKADLTL